MRLSQNVFDGVTGNEGEELKIAIPVVGQPSPNVTWMKDGEVIPPEEGTRQMWLQDGQAVLSIIKCRRADRGEYGIIVENYLGGDEAVFSVDINGIYCTVTLTNILLRHARIRCIEHFFLSSAMVNFDIAISAQKPRLLSLRSRLQLHCSFVWSLFAYCYHL